MPHIRVIQTEHSDGIYINGTLVQDYSCVNTKDVIDVLSDNLGIDIRYYDFCDDEEGNFGDVVPQHLRDFPKGTIDDDDRLGQGGLLSGTP